MDVARQDISKLRDAGWKPLTPITVKARDGKTDLYGFLFKPTNFAAAERYPTSSTMCTPPQAGSCGSRGFSLLRTEYSCSSLAETGLHCRLHRRHRHAQPFQELPRRAVRRHGRQHDPRPGCGDQGTCREVSVDRRRPRRGSMDNIWRRRCGHRARCFMSRTSSKSALARAATGGCNRVYEDDVSE